MTPCAHVICIPYTTRLVPACYCMHPTQANEDWVKTLTDSLDKEKGRLSATGVYATRTATSGTVNIWWGTARGRARQPPPNPTHTTYPCTNPYPHSYPYPIPLTLTLALALTLTHRDEQARRMTLEPWP